MNTTLVTEGDLFPVVSTAGHVFLCDSQDHCSFWLSCLFQVGTKQELHLLAVKEV